LIEHYQAAKLQCNKWQTRAVTDIMKSNRDYIIT